jgi:DNA replication protein DnaC
MAQVSKCEVLVLDDLLISPLSQDDQKELLEIVEERYDRKATIVTSQLPIKAWHDAMQDPTLADAILDRLVHNAYKVELKGESMRKKKTFLDRESNL